MPASARDERSALNDICVPHPRSSWTCFGNKCWLARAAGSDRVDEGGQVPQVGAKGRGLAALAGAQTSADRRQQAPGVAPTVVFLDLNDQAVPLSDDAPFDLVM